MCLTARAATDKLMQWVNSSRADALQDNPTTQRTLAARKNFKGSTVIAQTVGGDVVVELTSVDDENLDVAEHHTSDLSIHNNEAGGSIGVGLQTQGRSETKHLRVGTPDYHTFDSAEGVADAGSITRAESDESSFRPMRSSSSMSKNCRRTVTRRRQADTLSVASSSMRSRGSQASPYCDRRRESTASGGREHIRTTAMLVAVVLCFVVVELPQGLLAFCAQQQIQHLVFCNLRFVLR